MERNMDESRKAFEHWALEIMQFTPDDLTWDEKRNCYRDYVPHMAWKGWQASRADIEIELPTKNDISDDDYPIPDLVDWDDGRNAGIQECAEAIRAAGIKVKE
ncbi:hypothetical protein HGJ08_003896 [Salmonella enterica]|nr:hypothetical protein [Salmonella enterica]